MCAIPFIFLSFCLCYALHFVGLNEQHDQFSDFRRAGTFVLNKDEVCLPPGVSRDFGKVKKKKHVATILRRFFFTLTKNFYKTFSFAIFCTSSFSCFPPCFPLLLLRTFLFSETCLTASGYLFLSSLKRMFHCQKLSAPFVW